MILCDFILKYTFSIFHSLHLKQVKPSYFHYLFLKTTLKIGSLVLQTNYEEEGKLEYSFSSICTVILSHKQWKHDKVSVLAGCKGFPGSQVVLAGSLVLRRGAVGPKIAARALAGSG